jgi:hypothetical protein
VSDRIFERATVEFQRLVAELNNSRPDRHSGMCEAVVPWSHNPVRFTRDEVPQLIDRTSRVMVARAVFAEDAPGWAAPLPVGDDIPPLLGTTGPLHLLGLFSNSLAMADYNPFGHPSFATFGCGVMAHPCAPDHVRDDRELKCEFPAKTLPGLCAEMVWHEEALSTRMRDEILGFGFPPDLRVVT